MPEVWLLHPTDRVVTIYRLEGGAYGRPTILELSGTLTVAALPTIRIDCERLLR